MFPSTLGRSVKNCFIEGNPPEGLNILFYFIFQIKAKILLLFCFVLFAALQEEIEAEEGGPEVEAHDVSPHSSSPHPISS